MSESINFSKLNGLAPCVVQDLANRNILMVGFMNEEAYQKTCTEKKVTFYSRTKQRLWTKGETSGNYLTVNEILIDCDVDSILIKATPQGPVCHTGADTCFNESNSLWDLFALEKIIQQRKVNPTEQSYTSKLLSSGINKVAQKVGEEAVELVIEAKDNNRDLFLNEAADLLFHYLVLLSAKEVTLNDVVKALESRHKR